MGRARGRNRHQSNQEKAEHAECKASHLDSLSEMDSLVWWLVIDTWRGAFEVPNSRKIELFIVGGILTRLTDKARFPVQGNPLKAGIQRVPVGLYECGIQED